MRVPRRLPLFLLICLTVLIGCSRKAPRPKHNVHIRELWHVYFEYRSKAFKPEGARDAEALKEWATKNIPPERLKKLAVYDLQAAFVSPRDSLPYVVRPVDKSQASGGVIIHEAVGSEGKRLVAYGETGEVAELNEEEFKRAVP
jgi:hypothetical protein